MTKLVIVNLNAKAGPKRSSGPRKKAKTKTAERRKTLGAFTPTQAARMIDASSKTFGTELQKAFLRNVRKARQDNRRLLGYFDVAPRKV